MSLRNLLALLILLSIALLVASLVWNLPGKDTEEILDLLPQQVDLALEKIHYTQTEGGRRSWVLDADSAAVQREEGLISLQNVAMVFWQTGRYAEVSLTAREGLFDQQNKTVEIWGDVEIVTDLEERFSAERIRYQQATRQVSSEDRVHLQSPQLNLTGKGFRLDLQTGRMSVLQDVEARLPFVSEERSLNR
ncbi:MAG: LPS export ABC transporter periplasmic protein LptC [Desulfuromonadales bacterium]|nr:LPS export ABC transporter periplasmic protein LptC [Desulfuromonadales bacterium]